MTVFPHSLNDSESIWFDLVFDSTVKIVFRWLMSVLINNDWLQRTVKRNIDYSYFIFYVHYINFNQK
jgi:hypothetical protein